MILSKLVICNLFLLLNASVIYCQPNSLYPKCENGKWGYVNNKSKVVIQFQYIQAEPFSEGLAVVEKAYEYPSFAFIDFTGKKVFPDSYLYASSFNEGLALVRNLSGQNGYINTQGKLVIPYKYKIAEKFSNGFAVVGKDNPSVSAFGEDISIFAVINKSDNLLADRWFSSVARLSKDTFMVTIKDINYILLSNGEMLLKENKLVNYTDTSKEFYRLLNYKKEEKENVKLNSNDSTGDIVNFYVIDVKPEFPGGESAMMQWIAQNVKYPEKAKEDGIQGKVFVQFIIGINGKISDVEILKGANPLLDKEAKRVVSVMPAWKPGKHKGKIVRVSFQLPINFRLY